MMKPEVQEFFDSLTPRDIENLQAAINTYKRIQTAGWIIRWAFVSFVAIVISVSQFGDALAKIKEWFR